MLFQHSIGFPQRKVWILSFQTDLSIYFFYLSNHILQRSLKSIQSFISFFRLPLTISNDTIENWVFSKKDIDTQCIVNDTVQLRHIDNDIFRLNFTSRQLEKVHRNESVNWFDQIQWEAPQSSCKDETSCKRCIWRFNI